MTQPNGMIYQPYDQYAVGDSIDLLILEQNPEADPGELGWSETGQEADGYWRRDVDGKPLHQYKG